VGPVTKAELQAWRCNQLYQGLWNSINKCNKCT